MTVKPLTIQVSDPIRKPATFPSFPSFVQSSTAFRLMADWAHLYQNSLPTQNSPAMSSAADSTLVTTTSIGTSSLTNNNVQSRSGKPARRRSRASRKAPTTLVSTNTNNFRAMVQQFTGFPTGGQQEQAVVYQPSVAGGINQFNHQLQQHQVVQPFGGVQVQQTHVHELLFQNQQQQQMFSLRNSNVDGGFGGTQRSNMEDFSSGFLMEGMMPSSSSSSQLHQHQHQQQVMTSRVLPRIPTSSSSTEANGGFMLR